MFSKRCTVRVAVLLSTTITILGASNCFFGKKASSPAASQWSGEVPLNVVNHHWLDLTIFVIHDGQRTRVGTVLGSGAATFYLPRRILGQGDEIQLLADPIGSQEQVTTQTLVVQPGQYIQWTVEDGLSRSSAGVY
jgi:hypothetical protein